MSLSTPLQTTRAKPLLFPALALLSTASAFAAQTIVTPTSFFDPDFKVRRNGASSGILSLTVNNTLVSQTGSAGNISWEHSAGGHAQVRTQLSALGIPVANLNVQLAATTQTTGDSLVFGREITTTAQLLGDLVDVSSALQGLTNQVAGASVLYNWNSKATVANLAIHQDQLYRVNFTVTSGAGLPLNLLSAATFGITTTGITGGANQSAQLLNLLGLVSIGSNSSTGNFSFDFKSDRELSALNFNFAAATGVGVSLLGGTANNQNVLTFSGLNVTAIPEPSSLVMGGTALGLLALRRRRAGA